MNYQQKLNAAIAKSAQNEQVRSPRRVPPFKRSTVQPDAPAPRVNAMIAERGLALTTEATEAWAARLNGVAMVDVAHKMGVSIQTAKALINEAHAAIGEDLKESLEVNRQLDLGRLDGLINTYYAQAKEGDIDSANLVLKCLSHRSKLTGSEPPPAAGKTSEPQNVLVWIQQQMPSINKIVDALPIE